MAPSYNAETPRNEDQDYLDVTTSTALTTLERSRSLSSRVKCLIKTLSKDMYEREEIVAVSLLAAMSGQNAFLLGPPGTAKSLISRRIACAFEEPALLIVTEN